MSFDHKLRRPVACLVIAAAVVIPATGHAQRYAWPLRVEPLVTSTFGEFREGHVHAGIDLSTGGREGLPVYAVADGYVERVRCSPFGYGKAVYLRLDDGRTAVYAHLSEFCPELDRRVRAEQMRRRLYEVDLRLEPDDVRVRRDDIVGRSGSTGAGAPHLHLELRGTDGCPFNPFDVFVLPADDVPPKFRAVAVIPLDSLARVDGMPTPAIVPVHLDEATGRYAASRPVYVQGRVGVAVEVHDLGSNGPYRRGIHLLDAFVDGETLFRVRNDRFCYERGRQVYLAYDYSLLRRTNRRFLTAYRDIGNTLASYQTFDGGSGFIYISHLSTDVHTVTVEAADDAGNRSEVNIDMIVGNPSDLIQWGKYDASTEAAGTLLCQADFWPRSAVFSISSPGPDLVGPVEVILTGPGGTKQSLPTIRRSDTQCDAFISLYPALDGTWTVRARAGIVNGDLLSGEWSYDLKFVEPSSGGQIVSKDGLARVTVPPNGAYQALYGRVISNTLSLEPPAKPIGKAYTFEPTDQPLAAKCNVRIQCADDVPTDRVGMYRYNDSDGRWRFVSRYTEPASAYELGTFALLLDDVPPKVRVLTPADGSVVPAGPVRIEIEVEDEPAGIDLDTVRTELDGKPVICEYYPPGKMLRYLSDAPLAAGEHTMRIAVRDNVGNESTARVSFTVERSS